ncbi:MAG: divalent-cation tolerance protein CutA [Candidatus Aenigmarchaeota archaeon]|nr:divalent-cation tolerance protein CutA [Candidatus Aenigmarchaeota archaeon]
MPSFVSVYITCKDAAEAKSIAHNLVEEHLVACVNMFPVESVYRWKGKVQQHVETALVCKTHKILVKKITKRVKELHSYDTPCVVAWPISGGNKKYLDWVRDETKKQH